MGAPEVRRLAVLPLLTALVLATYQQNRNFYCQNIDTTTFTITDQARADLRSANSFSMALSLSGAAAGWRSGSYTAYLSGSGFMLIIFLLVDLIVLASLIFFAVNNCACHPKGAPVQRNVKRFWLAGFLTWIVALGGMTAIVVYIKQVDKDFPTMICGLSTVGFQIVNGLSTNTVQFIGFNSYSTLLQSFKSDLPNLAPLSNTFGNIQTASLLASAQASTNALSNFYDKYSTSTTSNATGLQSIPFIIGNFTPATVSATIGSQFSLFTSVASRLDNASATAGSLTGTQTDALSAALVAAVPVYQNYSTDFQVFFNRFSDNFTTIQTNMGTVFWGVLIAKLVTLVLAIVITIFLMRMAFQKDCVNNVKAVRWVMFVTGILVFLLGAVGAATMIVSLTLNTTCGITNTLLTSPKTTPTAFDLPNAASIIQVLSYCAVNTTKSQLSSLNATYAPLIANMEQILDGFTLYASSYPQIVAASTSPTLAAINSTINGWAPVYNGIAFDQPLILETYRSFVSQNNQTDVQYVFNKVNCTISNCNLIQNTSNFVPSENANNITHVSLLFSYLQAYIKSEVTLINNMVADLTSSDSSKPNAAIQATIAKLLAVNGNVTNVRSAIQTSLSTVASFTGGVLNYTNCTNLMGSLSDLEYTSCFNFKFNLLLLALLILATVIIETIALWLHWAGLRHVTPTGGDIVYHSVEDSGMMNDASSPKEGKV